MISIILFAPLTFAGITPTWLALLLRFVTRLLLVPFVAAIAYEIIRFSAAHDQILLTHARPDHARPVAAKINDP